MSTASLFLLLALLANPTPHPPPPRASHEICTLRNENLYFTEKCLWRSFCEPYILPESSPWHTFFVAAASSTATKGIFNLVSWKHRSRELGPKTRKTRNLWVFQILRPEKENNFSSRVCRELQRNEISLRYTISQLLIYAKTSVITNLFIWSRRRRRIRPPTNTLWKFFSSFRVWGFETPVLKNLRIQLKLCKG